MGGAIKMIENPHSGPISVPLKMKLNNLVLVTVIHVEWCVTYLLLEFEVSDLKYIINGWKNPLFLYITLGGFGWHGAGMAMGL